MRKKMFLSLTALISQTKCFNRILDDTTKKMFDELFSASLIPVIFIIVVVVVVCVSLKNSRRKAIMAQQYQNQNINDKTAQNIPQQGYSVPP